MSMKLYTFAGEFRAYKALISAQYNGVQLECPKFEQGKDNLSKEFLAKSPLGKVPLLETPHGNIFESNAIARYIAKIRRDTELAGRTFFEAAQVDSWMDFCSHDVELPSVMWIYPILGYTTFDQATHEKAVAELNKALATLERHLLSRTFVVGESVTLADICLVSALYYPFKLVLDESARAAYPSVTRWFVTCVNQPAFKAVLGEVELCQEAMAAGAGAGKAKAAAGGKKEEKKAEPKKEEKKAEAKKEEKKPKKKDDDEEEEEKPKEEKPRLPAEEAAWLVQKSPMDLDAVKRLFSNNKFEDCVEQFVKEFDHNVYSVWECNYNYNDENTVEWLTANLLGGFVQRLEESRKIAYGVLTMAGNKPFYVQGLFIFKYKEVPTYVKECPDYESYTFKQVDFKSEEGQKRFSEFWVGQTIDGRELKERRFFK